MSSDDVTAIRPVSPVAPYIGGKRNLAGRIIERIEACPHRIYAEPFVGMGGVFFRRRTAPRAEIINDLSEDVASFFRILQRHYVPFMEMLRFSVTSRREFERLAKTRPETLTDLERAARFLYLQRTTFGGKVEGRTFGVSPDRPARFDVTRLGPMLEDLHERLSGVVIECLSWQDFIARYDRPETLFYLDPPYWGAETFYGKALFAREDYAVMAEQLGGIRGRFILSLNDVPEIRQIFRQFPMEPVETAYSASSGQPKKVGELIITGDHITNGGTNG